MLRSLLISICIAVSSAACATEKQQPFVMQVVKSETVLTPEHVKVAFLSKDETGKPILDVAFTDEGLVKINELINGNFGGKLNIIFKSKALSRSSAIMLKSFKNNTIRITSSDDDIQTLDELKDYLNSN